MKLFLNTAVLCAIPKVVNATEVYLLKLITPDTPSDEQLELTARIAAENLEASRREMEHLVAHAPGRSDAYDEQGNILDIESPYTEVNTKYEFDLLNDQDVAHELQQKFSTNAAVVHGNGSRVHEQDMASNYNTDVKKKTVIPPPIKKTFTKGSGFTKDMSVITKEVHDKINEIWREMCNENTQLGKKRGQGKYITDDAARATNVYFGHNWGVSSLTRCLRKPGAKTRLERDDCPSQAEVGALVNGDVTRSVSQFSDMDKLNIKT